MTRTRKTSRFLFYGTVFWLCLLHHSPTLADIRTEPVLVRKDQSGTLFLNKEKAYPGTNILTTWTDANGCEIFRNDGKLRHLPGNFCTFIPRTGVVYYSDHKVFLADKNLQTKWSFPAPGFHHDLFVSRERKEIFFLGEERRTDLIKGVTILVDVVIGLNYQGKEIYRWRAFEHNAEIVGVAKPRRKARLPRQTAEPGLAYTLTHINSVTIIPKGYRHLGPAFTEGNLLISELMNSLLFVIDRRTGKLVWDYSERLYANSTHSARLTQDGHVLFFKNWDFEDKYRSEIAMLEPKTKTIDWSYRADSPQRFYSRVFGHVEEMPNGNILISDNPNEGGHAFEITRDKEIVWEWSSPFFDEKGERKPAYRVVRVPSEDLAEYTSLID